VLLIARNPSLPEIVEQKSSRPRNGQITIPIHEYLDADATIAA
jgi:hypothetical protein